MREIWLAVPDWTGYEVSSRGGVRSVERKLTDGRTAGGVLLKLMPDKDGYLYVTLSVGNRRRRVHVAVLVLEAFVGPCPEGCEACHGNGRRKDCRRINLRWGTRPENRQDREKHRQQRAARRAARDGRTGGTRTETGEIEETPSCPSMVVSGVSS